MGGVDSRSVVNDSAYSLGAALFRVTVISVVALAYSSALRAEPEPVVPLPVQEQPSQTEAPLADGDAVLNGLTSYGAPTDSPPLAPPTPQTTPAADTPPPTAELPPSLPSASPQATQSASRSARPPALVDGQIIELEALLAEALFRQKRTLATRAEVVGYYERIIAAYCMPQITRTLRYEGKPTEPKCVEYIDRTLALHANNAMALCARDGIDAKSCRTEASAITFGTYSLENTDQMSEATVQAALKQKIAASRNAPLLTPLQMEAHQLRLKSNANSISRAEYQKLMRPVYSKMLALSCLGSRTMLAPPGARRKRDTPAKSASNDILETLEGLSGRSSNAPTPTPTIEESFPPETYDEIRLLEQRCVAVTKEALAIDPQFPPALCHKWGYYSPQCIDAKRLDARRATMNPRATPTPRPTVPGFVAF